MPTFAGYPPRWLHLTFVVWAFSFFLLGSYPLLISGLDARSWLILWLAAITASGLCLSLLLSFIVLRVRHSRWFVETAFLFTAVLAASFLQSVVDHLVWTQVRATPPGRPAPEFLTGVIVNILIYIWIFGLYVTGLKLLLLLQRARARDAEIARAQAAAARAELAALRYQVQPDVLFTTLSSASAMVEAGRSAEATDLVDRLSGFMRGQLATDVEGGGTIGDEIEALDDYIALERTRTGREIELEIDCPEGADSLPGPTFLLQPLVETRLRFLVREQAGPISMRLKVRERRNGLRFVLEDAGPRQPASDFGEVTDRLRLFADADATLSLPKRDHFQARLDLPVQ